MIEQANFSIEADAHSTAIKMRKLYDKYFESNFYRERYPVPNPATLKFLLRNGAKTAHSILDIGCGDGRYAVALLDQTEANITGSDISSAALRDFEKRVANPLLQSRVTLIHGGLDAIPAQEQFDVVLLIFGVLSHAGNRAARIAMLKDIRKLTAPWGSLLLTVPSAWRRRPIDLFKTMPAFISGKNKSFGDVQYSRQFAGSKHDFFYHLYTVNRLKGELREAGWSANHIQAESVLPEKVVTQNPWVGRLDELARPLCPASLGYGIRVVAKPDLILDNHS
jgi:SAM-dependent methyltransferase